MVPQNIKDILNKKDMEPEEAIKKIITETHVNVATAKRYYSEWRKEYKAHRNIEGLADSFILYDFQFKVKTENACYSITPQGQELISKNKGVKDSKIADEQYDLKIFMDFLTKKGLLGE